MMDEQGHFHSFCLHWEGMPRLLCELLSVAGYPNPPTYEGFEFEESGVRRCTVVMTIPQHPLNPQWLLIVTQVTGHRLLDSWELAATCALTTFCDQHPLEVVMTPFGLFPVVDEADPLWLDRMNTSHVLAALDTVGTVRVTAQCLNAQYRLQVFQGNAIAQLAELAQGHLGMVIDRDFQIIELQGQVQQLQGQVHAPQTTVAEHEAMMEFLDEQIGELNMEIDNVQEQLQLQQMQQDALHAPPDVMDVDEEEPEEIECYSNVDFEKADPQPAQWGAHSPVASESSVNNLDDF